MNYRTNEITDNWGCFGICDSGLCHWFTLLLQVSFNQRNHSYRSWILNLPALNFNLDNLHFKWFNPKALEIKSKMWDLLFSGNQI